MAPKRRAPEKEPCDYPTDQRSAGGWPDTIKNAGLYIVLSVLGLAGGFMLWSGNGLVVLTTEHSGLREQFGAHVKASDTTRVVFDRRLQKVETDQAVNKAQDEIHHKRIK